MSGPAPKPTKLRILQGCPGHRPLNKREPRFETGHLWCPGWLLPMAKREWRRVIRYLKEVELVADVDRAVLAAYCQAYARWQQAEQIITEKGFVMEIETKGGGLYEQQRPEVSIAQKYQQLMLSAGGRLGFDPSSRTRLQVPERREEDPLATFLKGKDGG